MNVVALAASVWAMAGLSATAAPELRIVKQDSPCLVSQPYRITCEVSWIGEPSTYTILPAMVAPVDWAAVRVGEMSSEVRDGAQVVSQTVVLVPQKPGMFNAPAIEIPFLSPEDQKSPDKPDSPMHPAAPDAHPKLRSDPFPLPVQPHTTPAWLYGLLGAFLLLGLAGAAVVAQRRRRPVSTGVSPALDRSGAQDAMRAAKRLRIEGDYYGFYRELKRAVELGAPGETDVSSLLETRAQDAGYRGVRPPEDQMDGDVRSVERLLNA